MSAWWRGRRVTVTGGEGFVGRHLVPMLSELEPSEVMTFSSHDYDLARQEDVARMYTDQRPDVVIHLAARVGGIGANRENPGFFFYQNAIMGIELLEQARQRGVEKFVQVGTVCSYPKFAAVPFREDALWDGYPEETNAPYGVAKKALLVQAQAYRAQYGFRTACVLPANLYGPGDSFDLESSHVIPALIRKCVEARDRSAPSITVWGTGNATREFLYVDDAARGILLAAERVDEPTPINLGTSAEITIRDLVEKIKRLTGFEGQVVWDASRPDGQPRRKLDIEKARDLLGFEAQVDFEDGLRRTIEWYAGSLATMS
jgi:nucleoside-diphosphate-sugar epimerase